MYACLAKLSTHFLVELCHGHLHPLHAMTQVGALDVQVVSPTGITTTTQQAPGAATYWVYIVIMGGANNNMSMTAVILQQRYVSSASWQQRQ